MKSDAWLTERIIKEALHKHDISYIRGMMQQGNSDEEILLMVRRKMFTNSKGTRAYIRYEKVRALMVKLASGIHWVCLLPVVKLWITEKETLIKWKEDDHAGKIRETIRKLKNKLIDSEYKKLKFSCANGEALPETVMDMIEGAAEELLAKVEEEESARSGYSWQNDVSIARTVAPEKADGPGNETGVERKCHLNACRSALQNGVPL